MFRKLIVQLTAFFLCPTLIAAQAPVTTFDRRPLEGWHRTPQTDALAARILEHLERFRASQGDLYSLSADEWDEVADLMEEFAHEQAKLGNLKKLDDAIRVNERELKRKHPAAVVDGLKEHGVHMTLYQGAQLVHAMAQKMRTEAWGKLGFGRARLRFVQCGSRNPNAPCDSPPGGGMCAMASGIGHYLEAVGMVSMLIPALGSVFGTVIGVFGIAVEVAADHGVLC